MKNELDRHSAQEPKHKPLAHNKAFQILVAVVGVPLALTLFTACSASNSQHEITPTLPPPAVQAKTVPPTQEILTKTDQQIVEKETERLGIRLSENEGRLWRTFGYAHSREKLPITDATAQEAAKRVQATIILMQQSENPYIKNAASFIMPLASSGDASITVYMKGDSENKGSAMSASPNLKDGKLHWHIAIAANEVLNNSSGIILALELTHEIEHIKNMIAHQKSLPSSLSPQERLEKIIQRKNNPTEYIQEEARGYAAQSLAYIWAYGLGFRGGIGLSHQQYAAEFIRDGNSPNSILWQKYVAEEIMGIKNWQPKKN